MYYIYICIQNSVLQKVSEWDDETYTHWFYDRGAYYTILIATFSSKDRKCSEHFMPLLKLIKK